MLDPSMDMETWVLLTLGTVILWGIQGVLIKVIAGRFPWPIYYAVFGASMLAVSVVGWLISPSSPPGAESLTFMFVTAMMGISGALLLYIALKSGPVSIIYPLSTLNAGITAVLGIALLGEKISILKAVGVILAALAAILLSS